MKSTAPERGGGHGGADTATWVCDARVATLASCCAGVSWSRGGRELDRATSVSHVSGLGRSKDAVAPATVGQLAPGAFLKAVLEALCLGPAVVISPSLSGMYSLPFLFQHNQLLKAYVPMAPICTEKFTAEQYAQIKVWPGGTLREVREHRGGSEKGTLAPWLSRGKAKQARKPILTGKGKHDGERT